MQRLLCLFLGLLCTQLAFANVVVTGTRVIYKSTDKEVTVQLNNPGSSPALVQAWVESDISGSASSKTVPFVVTPPLFRMEANRGQSLRIMYTGEALPQDRESIFYLNVLDIPSKSEADNSESKNYLQLAIQARLKLFFRPAGLATSSEAAPAAVKWFWRQNGNAGYQLQASNQTPYHISYNQIGVEVNGNRYAVKETKMISPYSEAWFVIDNLKSTSSVNKITYTNISDYGANINKTAPVSQ